jgi:hypothetical protein
VPTHQKTTETNQSLLSPVSYDQNPEAEELHRSSSRTSQKFPIPNPNQLNSSPNSSPITQIQHEFPENLNQNRSNSTKSDQIQ